VPSDTERAILTAPAAVAKTAAYAAAEPEQRWMLRQPRDVRQSFAAEVFGRPDSTQRQEIWMLRQPKAVRESFIEQVLSHQRELVKTVAGASQQAVDAWTDQAAKAAEQVTDAYETLFRRMLGQEVPAPRALRLMGDE